MDYYNISLHGFFFFFYDFFFKMVFVDFFLYWAGWEFCFIVFFSLKHCGLLQCFPIWFLFCYSVSHMYFFKLSLSIFLKYWVSWEFSFNFPHMFFFSFFLLFFSKLSFFFVFFRIVFVDFILLIWSWLRI
jgi:hypothetical protein